MVGALFLRVFFVPNALPLPICFPPPPLEVTLFESGWLKVFWVDLFLIRAFSLFPLAAPLTFHRFERTLPSFSFFFLSDKRVDKFARSCCTQASAVFFLAFH